MNREAIIFRPGVVSAGPAVATWAEVQAAIAAADGDITVYIDGTHAAAHVPASSGVTDCQGATAFQSYNFLAGAGGVAQQTLTIDDGAVLHRPKSITQLDIVCVCLTTPSFTFNTTINPTDSFQTNNTDIALAAGATVSPINIGAGGLLFFITDFFVQLDSSLAGSVPVINIGTGATLTWDSFRLITLTGTSPISGGGAGATINFNHDANSASPNFAAFGFTGTVNLTRITLAAFCQPASGTTAQRPVPPFVRTGQLYYDTTLSQLLVWNGSAFVTVPVSMPLSGDVTGTTAATVVSAISGASPILIAPAVLEWLAATVGPTLTQQSESTATKGADVNITPQQSTQATNQGGGNVIINLQAPIGTGVEAALIGKRGAAQSFAIGALGATAGALSLIPGVALSTASYNLQAVSNTLFLNASAQLSFDINTVVKITLNSGLNIGVPVGGLGTFPFSWSGQAAPNTVACGVGGTQTISAAQAIIPFFLVTTGTLTSNAVIDFTTNAPVGEFTLDLAGVGALGTFTLGFKNGTTTATMNATQLAALRATGKTGIKVETWTANGVTIV